MINDRRPPMIRSCSSMIPARSDHVIAFRCIDPQISMQRLDRPPSLKIEPADSASDCNSRGMFPSSLHLILLPFRFSCIIAQLDHIFLMR
jgi:hypothetical protein